MVRKANTTVIKSSSITQATSSSSSSSESKKRKNEEEKVQPLLKKAASPFTNALQMFEKYKDEEDKIGPDGIMKFCDDLCLPPDSIQVLILAWQMNAKNMGYFTRQEFVFGLDKLKTYDLPRLKLELEQHTNIVKNDPAKFSELYKYSFGFSSTSENKRLLDLTTAAELLELILPNGVHTNTFIKFLKNTKTIKALTKDQWICFLEFTKNVKKDFSNYDESEAWPLLFDQFVEYAKQL